MDVEIVCIESVEKEEEEHVCEEEPQEANRSCFPVKYEEGKYKENPFSQPPATPVMSATTSAHKSAKVKLEVVDLEEPTVSALVPGKRRKVKHEPQLEWADSSAEFSMPPPSLAPAPGSEIGVVQQLLYTMQQPVDTDQVFGDYVSCELRSLRSETIKRRLKCTITKAIMEAVTQDM